MADEAEAAMSVAAITCNRFFVNAGDTHTRIAFGEEIDGRLAYRVAVTLSNSDADALAELVERLHIKHSHKKKP